MGIPVRHQGKTHGQVTGLEDCMGCARCVISCPTDALAIHDVRNLFRPALCQDASHLLKVPVRSVKPSEEPPQRPAEQHRVDWAEPWLTLDPAAMSAQAARCLDCGLPGCRNACPLGNPIPDWLEAAAAGDMNRAGELVHSVSALPEVCGRICPQHRLCESACTRGRLEGAVTIGALEQSLADAALAGGWRPKVSKPRTGRRVAIVGAGPAGIACAERLNREGVEVSVYDRAKHIGGLLYTGVPSFKLPKALLDQRRVLLEQAGILFWLGIEIDADQFAALLDTYDAVFLATGAQKPRIVDLDGQALTGVDYALPWLAAVNRGQGGDLRGQRVLVLGGGDTAMDSARSALRLGAVVSVAYRGPEKRLRASPKEVKLAREEGVKLLFEHRPLACKGEEKVAAVRFATLEGEKSITVERVILAFGQQADPPPWLAAPGVETERDGRIRIDARGASSLSKVWAGGDNTHGPDLAVTALAAGSRGYFERFPQAQLVRCKPWSADAPQRFATSLWVMELIH